MQRDFYRWHGSCSCRCSHDIGAGSPVHTRHFNAAFLFYERRERLMSLRKTPIAAALALCGAMPLVAQAEPTPAPFSGSLDVWFKAPTAGSTIKGVLSGGTNCYANTSGSVNRVVFDMDGQAVSTDSTPADGTQCVLDTTKFANGTHTFTATVYGTNGSTIRDVISVNVQNTVTPTPVSTVSPVPTPTTTTP